MDVFINSVLCGVLLFIVLPVLSYILARVISYSVLCSYADYKKIEGEMCNG